jgi:hypothetical protein
MLMGSQLQGVPPTLQVSIAVHLCLCSSHHVACGLHVVGALGHVTSSCRSLNRFWGLHLLVCLVACACDPASMPACFFSALACAVDAVSDAVQHTCSQAQCCCIQWLPMVPGGHAAALPQVH